MEIPSPRPSLPSTKALGSARTATKFNYLKYVSSFSILILPAIPLMMTDHHYRETVTAVVATRTVTAGVATRTTLQLARPAATQYVLSFNILIMFSIPLTMVDYHYEKGKLDFVLDNRTQWALPSSDLSYCFSTQITTTMHVNPGSRAVITSNQGPSIGAPYNEVCIIIHYLNSA